MTDGATRGSSACARRFGIAPDYHDIWGTRHAVVATESLVALLGDFGVDRLERGRGEAAERDAEADRGVAALPPAVAIARRRRPTWSVELRVPRAGHAALDDRSRGRRRQHGERDDGGARAPGDGRGRRRGTRALRRSGVALPAGYHRAASDGFEGETLLVAAPARCWRPPRWRTTAASGGRRSSSTRCARDATGASATSATWRACVEQWARARRRASSA